MGDGGAVLGEVDGGEGLVAVETIIAFLRGIIVDATKNTELLFIKAKMTEIEHLRVFVGCRGPCTVFSWFLPRFSHERRWCTLSRRKSKNTGILKMTICDSFDITWPVPRTRCCV